MMLFEPSALRSLTLRNRIAVSPMTQYSGEDGCAVPWHAMHVGSMAVSGAGLVIMEATAVEAMGRTTAGCLGLYSDANEAAMTRLVSGIRSYSPTPLGIQLVHAGRRGSVRKPWDADTVKLPLDEGGWSLCGPTAEPYRGDVHRPAPLDGAGIARVLAAFAAAARADRSGFDLLELHGAHGYLMHAFTSPISNTRTDGYGGSQARPGACASRSRWRRSSERRGPPASRSASACPAATSSRAGLRWRTQWRSARS